MTPLYRLKFLAVACAPLFGWLAPPAWADPAAVKVADAPPAISVTGRSGLKTTMYRRSRVTVPINERVGDMQEGIFCSAKGTFSMNQKLADAVMRQVPLAFREEMTRAGYPRAGAQSESLFEDKPSGPVTADFDVGGTIRGMQMSVCLKGGEIWGGIWFQMRWEIYSPVARKVMYETVTEGSYQNSGPEKLRFDDLMKNALAKAARNMLADQKFVDLMTGAVEIPVAAPAATTPAYAIKRGRAPDGGAAQNATSLRGAVATIEAGGRTGSGFFVSREGYALTNAHVVRDARIVKVRLATGREVVGEVLKSDSQRDVALLKTEVVGIEPLAIRETEPNVGEDVYALGSPLGEVFSGTLTRGILSGHRTLKDLRFLQSDVSILPGSSGGPLLDASGTVIGLTVAGLEAGRANLNLFIPIREALDKLAIELKD
jgi:S1-C subfamily serine protease